MCDDYGVEVARMRIYSVLLLWVLTYALNWDVAAGEDLQLVDGDVVVFMGGANRFVVLVPDYWRPI